MTLTHNFRDQDYVLILVAFKLYSPMVSSFQFSKNHVTRRRKSALSWNFLFVSFENQTNFFEIQTFQSFPVQILKSAIDLGFPGGVLTPKSVLALYDQIEMNLSQACTYFLTVIVWNWNLKSDKSFF